MSIPSSGTGKAFPLTALTSFRDIMTQKVSTVVGISPESFADAAAKAISAAAKTVRGIKWARVKDLEMEIDGARVKNFRATVDFYFDIEGR